MTVAPCDPAAALATTSLADVRRVVVLPARTLGDLLCATPALRALRAGLPQAHITLVGQPGLRALALRLSSIDDFVDVPGWQNPSAHRPADPAAVQRFLQWLGHQQFDLALQMHDSGQAVNALVAASGARMAAGLVTPQGWHRPADAGRERPWPENGSEVERLLRLTDHLQLPRVASPGPSGGTAGLEFPLVPRDRWAAGGLLAALGMVGPQPPLAVVHAGARHPSRRWPPACFAQVADALAARGLVVLLTGSGADQPATAAVARAMRHRAHDLAGCTSLWTLAALVDRAAVVVSSDAGVAHIAAALRRPSVVVASRRDMHHWAPADDALHRVVSQAQPGQPGHAATCPHDPACALAVDTAPVQEAALELLAPRPWPVPPDRPPQPPW